MNTLIAAPDQALNQGMPVIEDGHIAFLDDDLLVDAVGGAKGACVLVPSEQVLLVAVDLPLASHRQRVEAAPFAVEGLLADSLANVHVSLGPEIGSKRYLIGVVGHAVMADWLDIARRAGLSGARLVPDALTLPVPDEGSWTVLVSGGRVLVRRSDASGFAVALPALTAAWRIAGSPRIMSLGGALPEGLSAIAGQAGESDTGRGDRVGETFDLRQGSYAAPGLRGGAFLRRAAWIACLGTLTLAALYAADTLALNHLAEQKRQTAVAALQRVMPGIAPGDDPAADLVRFLPAQTEAARGRFLPLLSKVSAALNPQSEGLSIQSMGYDAQEGQLSMEITASSLPALQKIQSSLTTNGLDVSSGVATAEDGAARVRIVVHDSGAGAAL